MLTFLMDHSNRIILTAITTLLIGCAEHHFDTKPAHRIMENAHSGGSALAINADSTTLVSGGWAGRIKIWTLPEGKLLNNWKAHTSSVNGIAFIENDKTIVTAGYDQRVAMWDLNGIKRAEWNSGLPIRAFSILPGGRAITGHPDGIVRLWDLKKGKKLGEKKLGNSDIMALGVDKPGIRVVFSDRSNDVGQWNLDTGKLMTMESSPSYSRSFAYAPDGNTVYGSGWFKIFRWDTASGKINLLPTEHRGIINSIRFTPDGKLASISRQTDSSVLILDPAKGTTDAALGKHDLCGGYIAVSPNGCYAATNSDDSSVRIWKMNPECKTANFSPVATGSN